MRRLDLAPARDLLPALWAEWDGLRFAPGGEVVDPVGGGTRATLRLVEGQHRRPGASYLATVPTEMRIDLHGDDGTTVRATLTAPADRWSADVVVGRGPGARVEATVRIDLRAVLRSGCGAGCIGGLLGRRAAIEATGDTGGVAGTFGTSRFRGRGRVTVVPRVARWEVEGLVKLHGRGLGRLVLAVAGGRIRRDIDDEAARFWASAETWAADREAELAELAADTAAAGGPAPFVRRALWDPTFRPPSIRRLVDPPPTTGARRQRR